MKYHIEIEINEKALLALAIVGTVAMIAFRKLK